MVSAPRALKSTAILPAACTASTCSQPSTARTSAEASATGWVTPVSLLASIRQTTARPGAFSRSASQFRSATPSPSTGQVSTGRPLALALSTTASCSVAPTMMRSNPATTALSIARLLASVPPLRKVMEPALTPIRSATSARAASTIARAARPEAWIDEGLPPASRARATACAACGRTLAVAL